MVIDVERLILECFLPVTMPDEDQVNVAQSTQHAQRHQKEGLGPGGKKPSSRRGNEKLESKCPAWVPHCNEIY